MMLASWMMYSLVVAILFVGAAVPLSRAAQLRGWGSRWVWMGAVWGALLVPTVSHLTAGALAEAPLEALGPVTLVAAPLATAVTGLAAGLDASAAPVMARLEAPILRLWLLTTTVLLGFLTLSGLRLGALRRSWREVELDGERVLVSEAVGPAVVGLLRQRIVLPRWILGRPPEALDLILAHEREHVRARDPLAVCLTALPAVLVPWNPVLWWALGRLRTAVELDCDQRVLRGRTPGAARRYGQLLVEVGRRASRPLAAVAAFSEGRSSLERRIRQITTRAPRHGGRWATGLAASGGILVVAACLVPSPDAPATLTEPETTAASVDRVTDGSTAPRFTPYTVAPEIVDREEVQTALQRAYPAELRSRGIGGTTRVYFFIDEEGRVVDTRIDRSSGIPELDRAALGVAADMRFSPALNRDQPTAVWVSLPITFQVQREAPPEVTAPPPPPPALPTREDHGSDRTRLGPPGGRLEEGPTFTPYTVAPDVVNRSEVRQALEREYPRLLRDAGVGGTARVYIRLDESGAVRDTRIDRSSGHEMLDDAALAVAEAMRFSPALNRDQPVPVWVSLPVTFQVR